MKSPKQPLLSRERLPDESALAYRAFCVYRDLGPDRSLDQAWKRSDQGKQCGSARRPGYWSKWSAQYEWVARAEAHDDEIEEERRKAAAKRRCVIADKRSRFALEEQDREENLVRITDGVLLKMSEAQLHEGTHITIDKITGNKIIRKVKALNAREIAALIKVRNETAQQALGVFDIQYQEKERKAERAVWISDIDNPLEQAYIPRSERISRTTSSSTVRDNPESAPGNGPSIPDLDAKLDKAA